MFPKSHARGPLLQVLHIPSSVWVPRPKLKTPTPRFGSPAPGAKPHPLTKESRVLDYPRLSCHTSFVPRGGAMPGAGRPVGSKNTARILKDGAPGALSKLPPAREVYVGDRLHPDVSAEVQVVIDRALSRINDVMEQRVHPQMATTVLKAATSILEEVRGPEVQKVEQKVDLEVKLSDLLKMLDETERKPPVIVTVPNPPALPAKDKE